MEICLHLSKLPRLYSLKIALEEKDPEVLSKFAMYYPTVLLLPVLKHCTIFLLLDSSRYNHQIVIPRIVEQKSTSIEELYIDHSISLSNFLILLEHLPNIRRLKCRSLTESDENTQKISTMNVPFLKQISIENCSISFDQFEDLIKIVGQHVEIFELILYGIIAYTNGE